MADAWLCAGVNPNAPEEVELVVVVDPEGAPPVKLAARVRGRRRLLRGTDQRLGGATVGHPRPRGRYPAVPEGLDVELAEFAERSPVDSRAVRLLRVVARVDPVEYARTPEATIVFAAAADSSVDQLVAAIQAGSKMTNRWSFSRIRGGPQKGIGS